MSCTVHFLYTYVHLCTCTSTLFLYNSCIHVPVSQFRETWCKEWTYMYIHVRCAFFSRNALHMLHNLRKNYGTSGVIPLHHFTGKVMTSASDRLRVADPNTAVNRTHALYCLVQLYGQFVSQTKFLKVRNTRWSPAWKYVQHLSAGQVLYLLSIKSSGWHCFVSTCCFVTCALCSAYCPDQNVCHKTFALL